MNINLILAGIGVLGAILVLVIGYLVFRVFKSVWGKK